MNKLQTPIKQVDSKRPTGMFGFSIVWVGQIISLLGTSMTGFAMTIWAYEKTNSATALALVGFFFVAPMLIVSPFAGALVDRSNRKLMMMISDLASGIASLIILILFTTGHLQIWHLFITSAFQGVFQSFQWPAYSAAISTMIPKKHYGRANGMLSLADTASNIFAPILAGSLLGIIGVPGILLIDLGTFIFAIGALLLVHIPQPRITEEGRQARGSIFKEAVFGFRYIWSRPPLLALQIVFLTGNFFVGIPGAVEAAMILANTASNEKALAYVNSAGAIGGVIGGLVMSAWGGPKRRVHGVLFGWFIASLLGSVMMGFSRSIPFWAISGFLGMFFVPIINGSNQAIWQAKVPPDLQGKVFSIRRLIAWFVTPMAMLIAGPLSDQLLEPAMRNPESFLATTLGPIIGTGPGRGMALLFIIGGGIAAMIGISGYVFRVLRDADTLLPDHDTLLSAMPPDERLTRMQELLEQRNHWVAQPVTPEREQALKTISYSLRKLGENQLLPTE
jgi:MFS-type transporter involved in bile tolerance (Atg22 family)